MKAKVAVRKPRPRTLNRGAADQRETIKDYLKRMMKRENEHPTGPNYHRFKAFADVLKFVSSAPARYRVRKGGL